MENLKREMLAELHHIRENLKRCRSTLDGFQEISGNVTQPFKQMQQNVVFVVTFL